MSLSADEVERLVKWIEYHIKGYENEQSPQLLASYIKSLIIRKATQQRMIAVLQDFMDDKAEDFVNLLEKHIETKDFSIPEDTEKEKHLTQPIKKKDIAYNVQIEEVRPESLAPRPVITEKSSNNNKSLSIFTPKPHSSASKTEKESNKEKYKSEKDITKRSDKKSSISSHSRSSHKKDSLKNETKRETILSSNNEKSKKAFDRRSKDKYKDYDKKHSKYGDRKSKKDKILSYSSYSSSYDDYSDYDYDSGYDSGYDYDSDYYEYSNDDSSKARKTRPQSSYLGSQQKKKFSEPPRIIKNYRNKEKDRNQERDINSQYNKKRINMRNYKESTNQKNKLSDNSSLNSEKHQKIEPQNQNTQEPDEFDHQHLYIVAVCGIPLQFNTIGHILKEFNRFGLIHGIQVISEQNMSLIEFAELEAAYRAVNSRHHFFHNTTVKVDYAVQIDPKLLEPIAEKIRQKKLIVEHKRQEKILKKQRDIEARRKALDQAAALASAAINLASFNSLNSNNLLFPEINNNNENALSDSSDGPQEEDKELLLKTLAQKIAEYENLEDCDKKDQLKKDIVELSTYLDIIS